MLLIPGSHFNILMIELQVHVHVYNVINSILFKENYDYHESIYST